MTSHRGGRPPDEVGRVPVQGSGTGAGAGAGAGAKERRVSPRVPRPSGPVAGSGFRSRSSCSSSSSTEDFIFGIFAGFRCSSLATPAGGYVPGESLDIEAKRFEEA